NVNQCESTPASLTEPNSTLETRPERLLQSHSEQTSCTNMSPLSWQLTGEMSVKAVLCLSELREVVMRLHTKKLFPYNPSSLLKLNCNQRFVKFLVELNYFKFLIKTVNKLICALAGVTHQISHFECLRFLPLDFVMTLLAGFDSSLSALCSKLFPEEKKEMSQCVVDFTRSAHWGTTFCLMLDLLEVLTTSSLVCGAGSCLKSQRLTYHHSLALLTISCSSEYYVKKRVLLFLKRAVLQKVGEDWTLGVMASTQMRCGNWSSDMSMLAQTVLADADNWLQSVQVESAAFFGGTRHIVGDESPNSDCVVLRAVSLILLKSIEIYIQTAAGSGMDTATKVHASLQSLWGFLRRCSFRLREVTHLCCWISLLFGEQDDDMMEAARALLFIFLHYRYNRSLEAACASGFNPHCHFVFLLQSISFDHSILLDFLISAETCFLEYFVQYLKYLRDDWQGFKAACGGITVSALYVSPPGERFSLPAELRLVDYESSDESDPENTQDPEVQIVAPERLLQPVSHSEQTSCTNMSPLSWQLTGEMSVKAVLCLSELREVVMRLHTKKLFPYNPSSLLKLLAQVESCYQKSSQFSKS
uniref:Lines homolog 1 n=1 Tax=Amphilophus citrinellus TaxID=61819 RepID=A0A3Q0TFP3_AMPCI